jgi:hypothetical protein
MQLLSKKTNLVETCKVEGRDVDVSCASGKSQIETFLGGFV